MMQHLIWPILALASAWDIKSKHIPDWITVPAIVLGLILMPANWTGALIGGGCVFIVGFIGTAVLKRECMGGGDFKLMAAIGAFIGWKLALLAFFIAPVLALIICNRRRSMIIPYAPFLSLGAGVSMIWGEKIISILMMG